MAPVMTETRWRLVIYGGAGLSEWSAKYRPGAGLPRRSRIGASAGAAILEKRERALDAVEAAVRVLEEDLVNTQAAAAS